MKKKLLFIALLVLSTAAQAQSDARVAEIRKLYAEVKQGIELKIQADLPHDDMVVSLDYMAPEPVLSRMSRTTTMTANLKKRPITWSIGPTSLPANLT